jgi:4-hydroxybenzoyl-CoA thioesterase
MVNAPDDEAATGGLHVLAVDVGWGHCDPAGIVYFPRFFEMFHAAMESWFGNALGLPYQEVIVGRKLGFPSVHTEADFVHPTRFGERIAVELRVAKLGRSSIALAYRVRGPDGELRATGRTVCAVMDLDPDSATHRRSRPVPDDIRAAIEAFGVAR